MKFRNPWIDPRVTSVSPEQARAYLLAHGWKRLGPAGNDLLDMYEKAGPGGETPTALLPRQTDRGPMLQRMIDLIGAVALAEGRYAGSVIDDMLNPAGKRRGGPRVIS